MKTLLYKKDVILLSIAFIFLFFSLGLLILNIYNSEKKLLSILLSIFLLGSYSSLFIFGLLKCKKLNKTSLALEASRLHNNALQTL